MMYYVFIDDLLNKVKNISKIKVLTGVSFIDYY